MFQKFNKRMTTSLCEGTSICSMSKTKNIIWTCRNWERKIKMNGIKVGKSFLTKSVTEKRIENQRKSKQFHLAEIKSMQKNLES